MDLAKLKTLVVDDMSSMRMMVKAVLREHGIVDVKEASDGDKALEMYGHNDFQLIICDWDMPRMTGLEFLEAVRGEEAGRALPFIMLTANSNRDHVGKAIKAGVSDYIAKPFRPADLMKKIGRVLR